MVQGVFRGSAMRVHRSSMLSARIQRSPYWSLCTVFGCWKLLLASIALVTPSPAYDTSTALALLHSSNDDLHLRAGGARRVWEALCHSLTRWDAIYFAKTAQRGYANEQEWAFGWGYTQAVVATGRGPSCGNPCDCRLRVCSLVSQCSPPSATQSRKSPVRFYSRMRAI